MRKKAIKKVLRVIMLCTAILGYCCSVNASEETVNGIYQLVSSVNQEMVAGVTGGYWDDATELLCLYNDGTNYEKFIITEEAGFHTIQAVHSEKYIQTMDENGAGNILRQYMNLMETGNQKWKFINLGESKYQIQSANGLCLGTEGAAVENGTRIVLVEPDSTDATQIWNLVPTEKNEEEITLAVNEGDYVELVDGVYEISSKLNGTACWSMSADESLDNPLVITWERFFDDVQKFEIKKVREAKNTGDALYAISPIGTNKVLQKNYNGMIEAVDFVDDNGSQLWQFVYGGYGTYLIRCVDGVFASCNEGITENGTGIILQDYSVVANSDYLKWFVNICK